MNPMPSLRLALSASIALAIAAAAPARAEQRGAGMVYDRSTFPYGERVNQPLTLPSGMIRIDVPIVANFSKDSVGEPVRIPAAIDFGVTNDLQVGVFHAEGLCITGTSHGCPEGYDDVGARAFVGLTRTPEAQLAVEVSLLASHFDDASYQGAAALWYKRSLGNMGLTLDAGISSYLNKRSGAAFTETAFADAEGAVQLGESLSLFGRIGANRPLNTASGVDARTSVPVTLGVELEPIRKFDVGVELGFPNLLGQDASADERELMVLLRLFI